MALPVGFYGSLQWIGWLSLLDEVALNHWNTHKKPLLKGLSVALTFKLAAEIARTITVRSLDEIIQIGALIMVKAAITALIHWEWKSKDVMTDLDDID